MSPMMSVLKEKCKDEIDSTLKNIDELTSDIECNNKCAEKYLNRGTEYLYCSVISSCCEDDYTCDALIDFQKALALENELGVLSCEQIEGIYEKIGRCWVLLRDCDYEDEMRIAYLQYTIIKIINQSIGDNSKLKKLLFCMATFSDKLLTHNCLSGNINMVSQYTKLDNMKYMFHTKIKKGDQNIEGNDKLNLRMYNAVHMNDPLEGDVFNQLLKNCRLNSNHNTNDIEDVLGQIYPNNNLGLETNTYLASFSKSEKEALPMWLNYGGGSIGARIEISKSFFDKNDCIQSVKHDGINNNEHFCLYNVVYLKTDQNDNFDLTGQDKTLREYVEKIADTLVEIAKIINVLDDTNTDKINALDILRDILDQVRFLFKSDVYAYEEEVRVVKLRYKGDPNGILLSEVDDVLKVPKLYIELEKDIPYKDVSITLGAKVQKPKEVANYLRHIGVKSVKKSTMPYQ